jgi:hypothetical protein
MDASEFKKVKEARRALALIGYSSPKVLMNIVRSNMIKNYPGPIDISNAHSIFGSDIATMK